MKTSIEFLPENKQEELGYLVNIIREKHSVEMVILFGSYARGNWVEERNEDGFFKYQSDYDIFIVTETKQMANKIESDHQLRNRIEHIITTPISIIAHDIEFFNRRLRKGQYFFSDIKKEGVCLYNTKRFKLVEEKELSLKEREHLAEEDFEYWFMRAMEFLIDFKNAFDRGSFNQAAFLLHQATENFYNTMLLVFTRYKPNTHDLEKLSKRAASIDPIMLAIFSVEGSEEEKRRFELLRKAYVDARYNKNYVITSDELTWLADRVKYLQEVTKEICQNKIVNLV